MSALDNSFLTASTILKKHFSHLNESLASLPQYIHIHTSCLKRRVRGKEKREIFLEVIKEGTQRGREREGERETDK